MSGGAPPAKAPLRCRWGRHAPDPVARWNDGYYFSRCRRCGTDLVRTDYGRWEPPRGFRVVWRSSRPEHALGADLVEAVKVEAEPPPPVPPREPAGEELPIQAVLRQLNEEEAAEAEAEAEAEPETAEERPNLPPEPERPSRVPDFMDDPESDFDWRRPPPAPRVASPAPPAAPKLEEPPASPRFNPAFAGLMRRDRAAPEPVADGEEAGEEAQPKGRRRVAMVAAGLGVMTFVAGLMSWGQGSFAGKGDPGPAQPQRVALGAGQPVFVTASGLACRAEPGPGAAELRQLLRGDAVRLIARDGDWASIAHRDGQCWTPLRYLAVERPM